MSRPLLFVTLPREGEGGPCRPGRRAEPTPRSAAPRAEQAASRLRGGRRGPGAAAGVLLVALGWAASACSLFDTDPWGDRRAELARAEARWETAHLQRYRYTYRKSCECIPGFFGPVEITVDAGEIVGIEPLDPRQPTPSAEDWAAFDTVEDVFSIAAHAIDREAYRFDAEYDGARGYPTRLGIDLDRQVVDDELTVWIEGLEPLP